MVLIITSLSNPTILPAMAAGQWGYCSNLTDSSKDVCPSDWGGDPQKHWGLPALPFAPGTIFPSASGYLTREILCWVREAKDHLAYLGVFLLLAKPIQYMRLLSNLHGNCTVLAWSRTTSLRSPYGPTLTVASYTHFHKLFYLKHLNGAKNCTI